MRSGAGYWSPEILDIPVANRLLHEMFHGQLGSEDLYHEPLTEVSIVSNKNRDNTLIPGIAALTPGNLMLDSRRKDPKIPQSDLLHLMAKDTYYENTTVAGVPLLPAREGPAKKPSPVGLVVEGAG
jgi:hypothetical protein